MKDYTAELVLERRIAAPVSLVYSLLVEPDELRQWLGPHGFVVTELAADVRVGGALHFRMRKDGGGDYGAHGEFRELVENARVVFTWSWNEAPPGEPLDRAETLVTIAVRADGDDATVLTLTHSRLPDQESADAHGSGWRDGLDKLIARVEQHHKGHNHEDGTNPRSVAGR